MSIDQEYKKPKIEYVEDFSQFVEDFVSELTDMAGTVVTKATPLLAPLASGLTIWFAIYDGGGTMLNGHIPNAYLVAGLAGFLVMLVMEGITFSSIVNHDRLEDVKRSSGAAAPAVDSAGVVNFCMWMTIITVLGLESIPGLVSWWYGSITVAEVCFRFGILVFPLFSRAGAKIYSLSSLLDEIQNVKEKRAKRSAEREERKAEQEEQRALRMAKVSEEVARIKASGEAARAKILKRSGVAHGQKSVANGVAEGAAESIANGAHGSGPTPVVSVADTLTKQQKTAARRNSLVDLLQQCGDVGATEFGRLLGFDRATIYRDFMALKASGIVEEVDGKWKVKEIGPETETATPG